MCTVTLKELPYWWQRLRHLSVEDILSTLDNDFPGKVGVISAFGYSGVVLLHHIYRLGVHIDVYFIDTGYHFPETIKLARDIEDRWNLNVKWVRLDNPLRDYLTSTFTEKPWDVNANICCHYCKVEPLLRILPEKVAWLSALRRDQSYSRSSIDIAEIDGRGFFKVYPMAYWTRKQTWKYISDHDLPYNSLYDQNYASIGCMPCTVPVELGGDERDGRWKLSQKMECGIHLHK